MASLTLKVGATESTYDFKKPDGTARTVAEVAQILQWFLAHSNTPLEIEQMPEGLTVAQQNQWRLDQALKKIVGFVRREAKATRLRELEAAQNSVAEQAESETGL